MVGPVAAAAGAAFAAGVVALADPFKHHLSPPCLFHALTGLWCPFCGGTRAAWAFMHGDWRLMMHANALFPTMVAVAAWTWLAWLGRATGWWQLRAPQGRAVTIWVLAVLVCFTLVRNLPGMGALAPPARP